jgi:hypothetical protein
MKNHTFNIAIDIRKNIKTSVCLNSNHIVAFRWGKNHKGTIGKNKHGWWIKTTDGDKYTSLKKEQINHVLKRIFQYDAKKNGEGCYLDWCEHNRNQLTQDTI